MRTTIVILLAVITFSGCKKSFTDGIVFAIGTSNFKYTAMVQVRDAANKNIAPGNLTVNVSGPNANLVYDLTTGKKNLTINPDGTIQLVVSPTAPLSGPVTFNLSVSSPGYFPVVKPITITPTDSSQVINIGLSSPSTPVTSGTYVGVAQFALVNGALPHQTVAKIGSDNALHIASVNSPVINSKLKLDAAANGSTPANQVTYYDDGLTSIVLPQGTTFHYYTLKQTGTVTESVSVPHVTPVASINVTGVVTGTITQYKTYYTEEAETYPVYSWTKEELSGAAASSDSIAAVINYAPGDDITTKISLNSASSPAPTIHTTISNQDILQDELLFNTVVSKKLAGNPVFYKIHHATTKTWYDASTGITHKNETVPPYIVYDYVVSPDETAQWFTSFVIDPTAINPNTGKTIADGDLLEIGIDSTNKTVTQTVKKVANGQLRVQMLSYDAGYFYKAPNIQSFNYTINLATNVADPENANCTVSLLGGIFGYYFTGGIYGSAYYISGKIASKNTINTTSTASANYWGNPVGSAQSYGLNAVISPFNFAPPHPTTTFKIYYTDDAKLTNTIVTTSTPISGKNYGAVTVYTNCTTAGYGTGIINVSNGSWSTNNFPVGTTITGSGFIDGFSVPLSYTIVPGINNIYWESPKWN